MATTDINNTWTEGDTRIQNLNLAFSFCLFSSLLLLVSSLKLILIKVDMKGLFTFIRLMLVLKMWITLQRKSFKDITVQFNYDSTFHLQR